MSPNNAGVKAVQKRDFSGIDMMTKASRRRSRTSGSCRKPADLWVATAPTLELGVQTITLSVRTRLVL